MHDRMLYNQMNDNFAVLIVGNLKLPLLTVKFSLGKSGRESSQIICQIAMNNVISIKWDKFLRKAASYSFFPKEQNQKLTTKENIFSVSASASTTITNSGTCESQHKPHPCEAQNSQKNQKSFINCLASWYFQVCEIRFSSG